MWHVEDDGRERTKTGATDTDELDDDTHCTDDAAAERRVEEKPGLAETW